MSELNNLQFAILECLYFVEPYQTLLSEIPEPENLIAAELRELIARRWVQPMQFDEAAQDYVRTTFHDKDDLHAYRYLATKEGLLVHSGRR